MAESTEKLETDYTDANPKLARALLTSNSFVCINLKNVFCQDYRELKSRPLP